MRCALYYECHVTIEPVLGKRPGQVRQHFPPAPVSGCRVADAEAEDGEAEGRARPSRRP
jgi:hypothetical protein